MEPLRRGAAGVGTPGPERGRAFVRALEDASRSIKDPVAKLRYLRASLDRYETIDRDIAAVPSPIARSLLYRWLHAEGLRPLTTGKAFSAPMLEASLRRSRLVRGAVVLLALATIGVTFSVVGASLARAWPRRADATGAAAPVAAQLPPVAESLAPLPKGVPPAPVWIVEKGDGFEQYSNGLRIDTTFATAGDPRRYRNFDERSGMLAAVGTQPIGIMFHTSESDIWPMEASNNERLRDSSHHLLRYVQRNRSYNYLVDRFGRVFRVVEEEDKANHAGASIWEKDGVVFLNLNNAFVGVCFETRWDGGRALPITAAQLAAGRSLTEYLRQRWSVPGDLCVTHGLASVNPKLHLIGHHVDWARGFPFEAFGLPDQYAKPAASVAMFGFGYDGDFLKAVGEPWPGVREAEHALAATAATQGKTVERYRHDRQALYDAWHAEQTRDDEAAAALRTAASGATRAKPALAAGARAGGSGG